MGHPTGLNQPRRSDFLAPWFIGKWDIQKASHLPTNKQPELQEEENIHL